MRAAARRLLIAGLAATWLAPPAAPATTVTPSATATPGPVSLLVETAIGAAGGSVPLTVYLRANGLPVAGVVATFAVREPGRLVGCSAAAAPAQLALLPPGCVAGETCTGVRVDVPPSDTAVIGWGTRLLGCEVRIDDDARPGTRALFTCDEAAAYDADGAPLATVCEPGSVHVPGAVAPPATPLAVCGDDAPLLYDARFDAPRDTPGRPPSLDTGPFPRHGPSLALLGEPLVAAASGGLTAQPLLFETGAQLAFELDAGFTAYRIELDVQVLAADRPPAPALRLFVGEGLYRIDLDTPGIVGVLEGSAAARRIGVRDFAAPLHLRVDVDRRAEAWQVSVDGEAWFQGPRVFGDVQWLRLVTDAALSQLGSVAVDDVRIRGCADPQPPRPTPTAGPPTPTPTATCPPVAPPPTCSPGALTLCGDYRCFAGCVCACAGDCDGSGAVSVAELVRAVHLGLTGQPTDSCPALDCACGPATSCDHRVRVACIVAGVASAVAGCPGVAP